MHLLLLIVGIVLIVAGIQRLLVRPLVTNVLIVGIVLIVLGLIVAAWGYGAGITV